MSQEKTEVIEYYYALASPWSYLGNDELKRLASIFKKTIDPIIIDYDVMFEASGTIPLPKRPPLRKSYRLKELARWSKKRGVELDPEPPFYKGEEEEPDELLAALMVTAIKMTGGDSLELAHAISRALWAENRFPFTESELFSIATELQLKPLELISRARSEEVSQFYRDQTQKAIDRGVFGMPFYIYKDEPFWGQDRLEMLADALSAAG